MNLFNMVGAYGPSEAFLYETLVAPAAEAVGARVTSRVESLVPKRARVLDLGCGTGRTAAALARRRPDLGISAVDLNPWMTQRAVKRFDKLGIAADVVNASADALPFPDGFFDAVYSIACIKHWPDPGRGLREILRVLKPQGLLAIAELDRGCSLDDAREFVRRWRLPFPARPIALPYFRTYAAGQAPEAEEIRRLFEAHSIVSVEVRKVPTEPFWLAVGRRSALPS